MTKIPFVIRQMKSPAPVPVFLYSSWLVVVVVVVVVVAAAVFCIHPEQQLAVPASAVVSAVVGLDRQGHPQDHDDDHPDDDAESSSSWFCASDLACNLNGRCVVSSDDHNNNIDGARNNNNFCVCDQGWIGVNCSTLDLIPTASNSGYRPVDRSSWGASVWYEENEENDNNSGRYYMIAAEMVEHCGLTSWRTHSKTILATSTELAGPYEYHSTIVGLWTHNPTVVKLPAAISNNYGRSSSLSSYTRRGVRRWAKSRPTTVLSVRVLYEWYITVRSQ
jgi:hypothetical protein